MDDYCELHFLLLCFKRGATIQYYPYVRKEPFYLITNKVAFTVETVARLSLYRTDAVMETRNFRPTERRLGIRVEF